MKSLPPIPSRTTVAAAVGSSAPGLDAGVSRRSWLSPACLGLLLLGSVLWVYWPARQHQFINYDDDVYVVDNLQVQHGVTTGNVAWALRTFHAGNWHPLTWLSHMLDCRLFGVQPAGHHLVSVALHALTTLLLFLVLRRITAATWRSFVVAAFFGLHPLHVESVAWVAERKDVLSGLFFVLTLWAYGRYAEFQTAEGLGLSQLFKLPWGRRREESVRQERWDRTTPHVVAYKLRACRAPRLTRMQYYAPTVLFCALGLMSKPMLVTLPFVLSLLDFWPLRRVNSGLPLPGGVAERPTSHWPAYGWLVVEKLPMLCMAAVVSVLTWLAQRQGGAVESLARWPLGARVENAVMAYGRYLGKLFWPAKLSVFYPNTGAGPGFEVVAIGLGLIALTVWFWRLRREQPWWLVGWLWFSGMLVPVIGLVQVGFQSLADRYTYLPSIGVFIAVVWGAHAAVCRYWPGAPRNRAGSGDPAYKLPVGRAHSRGLNSAVAYKLVLALAGCCSLLACAVLARRQVGYWQSSGTLFEHALAVTTRNPIAELHLGSFQLLQPGQAAQALAHLQAAVQFEPRLAESHDALGTAFYLGGRRTEAVREFQQAITLKPDYAIAHFNLAVAYQAEARAAEALEQFDLALAARPDYAEACSGKGAVLAGQGKLDAAIACFEQAVALNPRLAVAHFNLGLALARQGRRSEAADAFAQALALRPDYEAAREQLRRLRH